MKLPLFGSFGPALQRRINPRLQLLQPIQVTREPQPDDSWPSEIRKATQRLGSQEEARALPASGLQRRFDFGQMLGGDIAEEFQRQVQLIEGRPAHRLFWKTVLKAFLY